jgi:hypothetical protein
MNIDPQKQDAAHGSIENYSKLMLYQKIRLATLGFFDRIASLGEVSEWLKEHAWKVCMR